MQPMKRFFLVCLLLQAFHSNAQTAEFGIGGGFSINTAPSGGNQPYVTDQSVVNYSGTMKLLFTGKKGWQFGFDGHVMELSGKSSKVYPSFYDGSDSLGGDGKKFVYAKYAIAACLAGNKVFTNGTNAFYLGLAAGYAGTRNNTTTFKANESYKAPDGGQGYVLGGQIGYVAGLGEKLGLNVEVAVRNFSFTYEDGTAPLATTPEKLKYNILAFPVTIGIRYYFAKYDPVHVPRSSGRRPKGRSMY